jgi:hypothetical protein
MFFAVQTERFGPGSSSLGAQKQGDGSLEVTCREGMTSVTFVFSAGEQQDYLTRTVDLNRHGQAMETLREQVAFLQSETNSKQTYLLLGYCGVKFLDWVVARSNFADEKNMSASTDMTLFDLGMKCMYFKMQDEIQRYVQLLNSQLAKQEVL